MRWQGLPRRESQYVVVSTHMLRTEHVDVDRPNVEKVMHFRWNASTIRPRALSKDEASLRRVATPLHVRQ